MSTFVASVPLNVFNSDDTVTITTATTIVDDGAIQATDRLTGSALPQGVVRRDFSDPAARSPPTTLQGMRDHFLATNLVFQQSVVTHLTDSVSLPGTYKCYEYLGYLNCPTQGTYGFRVSSDDASHVFVDGKRVAYWYGTHGLASQGATGYVDGSVVLPPGLHRIVVQLMQGIGGVGLSVSWKQPTDTAFADIPAASLRYDPKDLMYSGLSALTGVYTSASNQLELKVGGTTAMTASSSSVQILVPLTVNNTTLVANLNAALLGGNNASYYSNASNLSLGTLAMPVNTTGNVSANNASVSNVLTAGSLAVSGTVVGNNITSVGFQGNLDIIKATGLYHYDSVGGVAGTNPNPNFNVISSWNGFIAYNSPSFLTTGGYNNGPLVRLARASSQYFDGGSQAFNIATGGGFTILALVKFTGTAGAYERIIDFGTQTTFVNDIVFCRESTGTNLNLAFWSSAGSFQTGIVASAIVQDQWAVFAGRYTSSTATLQLYKNDVQIGGTLTSVPVITNRTVPNTYIGRSVSASDAYANMDIGCILVYDRSLSIAELTTAYQYCINDGGALPATPIVQLRASMTSGTSRNIRTIEIGASNRYSQIAMPYEVDKMYYRRHAGNASVPVWASWCEIPMIENGNFSITGNASVSGNLVMTSSSSTGANGIIYSSALYSGALVEQRTTAIERFGIGDYTGFGTRLYSGGTTLTNKVGVGFALSETTFIDGLVMTRNGTSTTNANVGINTSAPTASLHALGNVRIEGNLACDANVSAGFLTASANVAANNASVSNVLTVGSLRVSSNTVVANLNAELLGGNNAAFYRNATNMNAGTLTVAINAGSNSIQTLGAITANNITSAAQTGNLDTSKEPGLYHYDGSAAPVLGTLPSGNSWNYRTIEVGASNRYTQLAFPWDFDKMYFRRRSGTVAVPVWGAWLEVPLLTAGAFNIGTGGATVGALTASSATINGQLVTTANVGINTPTPLDALHVTGNLRVSTGDIVLTDASTVGGNGIQFTASTYQGGLVERRASATDRYGVGVGSVSTRLYASSVQGSAIIALSFPTAEFGFRDAVVVRRKNLDSAATTANVGINTSNPLEAMHVVGNMRVDGAITASGDVTAFSDKRLKANLVRVTSSLDKLAELTGYTFDRKDMPGLRYAGLVAQDVQRVLPEAVAVNSEGILAISATGVLALLVEAVKTLHEEVESLKKLSCINS